MNNLTDEISRLVEFSIAIRESTLKRLRKVSPQFYNWHPGDGGMSFSDIAHHLIEADRWLFTKIDHSDIEPMQGSVGATEINSPAEFVNLLTQLESTGLDRIEFLSGLTDAKLREKIFDSRFQKEVSIWWIIARGNLDHEIHHRGQIATYLRIVG